MSDDAIWGLKTNVWFGICLAFGLLFLWCLMSMLDAEAASAGYIWGLVVFGAVAIAAAVIALIGFSAKGGVKRAKDQLTRPSSTDVLRRSSGRDLVSGSYRPSGAGDVPRSTMGRALK